MTDIARLRELMEAFNSTRSDVAFSRYMVALEDALPSLLTRLERAEELAKAANALVDAENDYRHKHDLHGGGHIITGRAWDAMRNAGDKVCIALAKYNTAAAEALITI